MICTFWFGLVGETETSELLGYICWRYAILVSVNPTNFEVSVWREHVGDGGFCLVLC